MMKRRKEWKGNVVRGERRTTLETMEPMFVRMRVTRIEETITFAVSDWNCMVLKDELGVTSIAVSMVGLERLVELIQS